MHQFMKILLIAEAMGLLKLGTVSLDGTKIKANAIKHKASSREYANKLEAQLKNEVAELPCFAEEARPARSGSSAEKSGEPDR